MAKVRNNLLLQGLSGSLGDLVIKQTRSGQTIVTSRPRFRQGREFSAAQKSRQDAFREATAYAQVARHNIAYLQKAAGSAQSPYNVAIADWFHAPEILEVDLSAWDGAAGQHIRVQATDDVQVTHVTATVTDENGAVFEQGAAVRAEGLWWVYTTTAAGGSQVTVTARDLPGHTVEMVQVK